MRRILPTLLALGGLVGLGGCETDAQRGQPPFDSVEADRMFRMESKPVGDPSTDPYSSEPEWLIDIPVEPPPKK